jgi:hypothetical protein
VNRLQREADAVKFVAGVILTVALVLITAVVLR